MIVRINTDVIETVPVADKKQKRCDYWQTLSVYYVVNAKVRQNLFLRHLLGIKHILRCGVQFS